MAKQPPRQPAPAPQPEPRPAEMTTYMAAVAVGVAPDQVFAFRDYGDHLVVVTVDGRKLSTRLVSEVA